MKNKDPWAKSSAAWVRFQRTPERRVFTGAGDVFRFGYLAGYEAGKRAALRAARKPKGGK